MKRKFLEDKGLSKEVVDDILDENSKDIGKAKAEVEALETQLETAKKDKEGLQKQLDDTNKQLETLKNSSDDVEGLKKQIEDLQKDNKDASEAHAKEIKQLKVDAAVNAALTAAKAKNPTAVKALLKDLDKAELADDGTIKGLDEQIAALQKSDDYLFDKKEGSKKKMKGAEPGETGKEDGDDGDVDFSKMSYSELAAYLEENPDAKLK